MIRRTTRAYILLFTNDKVLLIKNWLGDGKWALPGGGIRPRETPENAALRECKEELGVELSATSLKLLSKGKWQTHRLGHHYYIFGVNLYTEPAKVKRLEIIEAKWLSKSDIRSGNSAKEIVDAIEKL